MSYLKKNTYILLLWFVLWGVLISSVYHSSISLNLTFDKAYPGHFVQVFWNSDGGFTEKQSSKGEINKTQINLNLKDSLNTSNEIRLHSIDDKQNIVIEDVSIGSKLYPDLKRNISMSILEQSLRLHNTRVELVNSRLIVMPENNDSQIIISSNALSHMQKEKNNILLVLGIYATVIYSILFVVMVYIFNRRIKIYEYLKRYDLVLHYADNYRWAIVSIAILVLTFLQIHGSSIGMYAQLLQSDNTGVLLGKIRPIRSDEWAVLTPMILSQYYTGFNLTSDIIRAIDTKPLFAYGVTSWDWIILFKPFHWGFFAFPPANGLSFFWVSRQIVLFMVSYEFGRILFNSKKISIVYALMVALAPVVQWWFAVNTFVEILVFGQLAILSFYYILHNNQIIYRSLFVILFAYSIFGYIFSLYPAWQVSFAYVFGIVFIWVAKEAYQQGIRPKYADISILTLFLIFSLGFAYISYLSILSSWDVIQAMRNTVYPGHRVITGGGYKFSELFLYMYSSLLPFKDLSYINNSEASQFYSIFPIGIIAWLLYFKKYNMIDFLAMGLIIINVIFLLWIFLPWPLLLAKTTLLYLSPNNRIVTAIAFSNVILLLRLLSIQNKEIMQLNMRIIVSLLFSLMLILLNKISFPKETSFSLFLILMLFPIIAIVYGTLGNKKRLVCAMLIFVSVVSGSLVNPITKGIASVYKNDLSYKIQSIVTTDKNANWIVIWNSMLLNSYPIMLGAKTINSTNIYPALERWSVLGSNNEEIYNRYAHIIFDVSGKQNEKFELLNPDVFKMALGPSDLKTLNITYILSDDRVKNSTIKDAVEPYYSWNGFTIYKVKR